MQIIGLLSVACRSNDGLDGRPEGGPHLMETTFIFSDSGMRWFKRFGWQLDHSSALDQS